MENICIKIYYIYIMCFTDDGNNINKNCGLWLWSSNILYNIIYTYIKKQIGNIYMYI